MKNRWRINLYDYEGEVVQVYEEIKDSKRSAGVFTIDLPESIDGNDLIKKGYSLELEIRGEG